VSGPPNRAAERWGPLTDYVPADSPIRSFVEVNVFPGRIEIYERCGHGLMPRLIEGLKALGLETEKLFESPCG